MTVPAAGCRCPHQAWRPVRATARTFSWCSIAGGAGTGPVGYSRCMIVDTQNTQGGTDLGQFYNRNRVLDRDPFRTWITA